MHVMELTDGRYSGHRQFGIGEPRDRVQVIRPEPFYQPVHLVPPAPERARAGRAALGPPTKRALESVGMGRGETGHDPVAFFVLNGRHVIPGIHGFNTCPFLITVCTGFPPKK